MTFQWDQHVIKSGEISPEERRLHGIINHVTIQNEQFRQYIIKLHLWVLMLAVTLTFVIVSLITAFLDDWLVLR